MKFQAKSGKNRKLIVNWEHINIYVSRYLPNTPFDVEVVRRQPKKSDPMRKYYFAAVLPEFMKHLGYEPEEEMLFHRQLKIVYFKIKPDKKGIYRNVPSVFSNESAIPVSEKKEFVDWVVRKAGEEGVYIHEPTP